MMLLRFMTSMLVLFTYCLLGVAQELPQVVVRTDRSRVQIADPFELRIEVTADSDSKVQFPSVGSALGNFEVIGQQDLPAIPAEADSQSKLWIRILSLETLESGELEIPAMEVLVDFGNGQSKRIATTALTMPVASSVEEGSDPTKFNDIRDVIDLAVPEQEKGNAFIFWSVAAVVGSLAASAAVLAVTFRKRWTSPVQWAKSKLDTKQTMSFAEIESVFRVYLAKEFERNTTTLSNDDVETFVAEIGVSEDQRNRLATFLSTSDQCKFAGKKATDTELATSKSNILDLIAVIEDLTKEEA